MATVTISLPDPMKEWIERQVRHGAYDSPSDYVIDLVQRDLERAAEPELSLEDLRRIVDEARAGGTSSRSIEDIKRSARQAIGAGPQRRDA